MHFKTDFLISAVESPIEIRLHTYTDTRRAHQFAGDAKKEPVTVDTYNPLSGETEKRSSSSRYEITDSKRYRKRVKQRLVAV